MKTTLGSRSAWWGQGSPLRHVTGWPFFQDDPRLLQNNQTKYVQEFLGIVAIAPVDPAGVGEAVRALCELGSIYWVRKGDGKWEELPSEGGGDVTTTPALNEKPGSATNQGKQSSMGVILNVHVREKLSLRRRETFSDL